MYAIVKTGGKQYKVAAGDRINIEKIDAEVGATIELEAICIVDGDKVEVDPAKAAQTKVTAVIIEQFKGDKQLIFKFKKRKNYKKLRGHRQRLTRVEIESVGADKAPKKAAAKKAEVSAEEPAAADAE
ncbi:MULTISPECIES: 50S ribosomal protein L21 [unclassified Adlercreutzia]|uniref:50S ribosomal protein L21 n=1 Tax=unclassified Adlercreutzia TaxID=2636013 RepID=UPI0013EBE841|nr:MULTISPECIES: 50S ribosomal protein L21 [unclassified Adlercreutzia]